MPESVFEKIPEIHYHEESVPTNFDEFKKVVESRRSIRVYTQEKIPPEIMRECLRLTLLAPNSSNLQPWEFYWVKSPDKKSRLIEACLSQPSARTAAELVVCVARRDTWKRNRKLMIDLLEKKTSVPRNLMDYYKKLVPVAYALGPLNLYGWLKWVFISVVGLRQPVPRGPVTSSELRLWAEKTTALACENLMLALRAAGYDSCPMEGFDEVRVKKILHLPRKANVVMVISAGRRDANSVYGERVRFDDRHFIFEV